jgi:hypothetical protein
LPFWAAPNETKSGLALNYELVWTDDSGEAVAWIQEEFDSLWTAPEAVELADAVVKDVARLTARTVVPDLESWREREGADPASPVVELPVYRRDNGLWAHQKYFIRLAFEDHRRGGARFVLADQVGLGKTIQLGLAAKLMALWGGGRILVLVPKPIGQQWQDELWRLLQMRRRCGTGGAGSTSTASSTPIVGLRHLANARGESGSCRPAWSCSPRLPPEHSRASTTSASSSTRHIGRGVATSDGPT